MDDDGLNLCVRSNLGLDEGGPLIDQGRGVGVVMVNIDRESGISLNFKLICHAVFGNRAWIRGLDVQENVNCFFGIEMIFFDF